MAMNLKSVEARELAGELARLLGVSMTEAVVVALREKLERSRPKVYERTERAATLVRDMRSRLKGSEGIGVEDLYDSETGLPK